MPTLTQDAIGEQAMRHGTVNLWGGSPADTCTMNSNYGCERSAAGSGNIINPIRSARLRTINSLNLNYGRVEVTAKLPRGDWLWPAIWMLPTYQEYGPWPVSGEIDIMESRGNGPNYPAGGNNKYSSSLHWGADWSTNKYHLTTAEFSNGASSLADDFHIYGLYWDSTQLYTYIDRPQNTVLKVDFRQQSFYQRGRFPTSQANPWINEPNSAPFNREFHLILNLAVGGTNAYFPDGIGAKPWSNQDSRSVNAFYDARGTWLPTWRGEDAALKIRSVKAWAL